MKMDSDNTMLLIPPSKEIVEKIKADLYQDPEATARDIKSLREWIAKNTHLPQEHDDIWLERFLYGCRYSVERSKKVLELHYSRRTELPQYFRNVDPLSENIKLINNVYYSFILPQCTAEGYRVTVKGLLDYDINKYNLISLGQREMLFFNCFLRMESNYGLILVIDMNGVTTQHVLNLLPYFQHIVSLAQDSAPARLKQTHFIHAPPFVKTIISALKPLLKEKFRNRFHVHTNDLGRLYEFIPQEILPNEFGGKSGTITDLNNSWIKQVESMRDWILEEYKKKIDESKCPKECNANELFGIDGTFKKLNID